MYMVFIETSTFTKNSDIAWFYYPPFIEGEAGEVRLEDKNKVVLAELFDAFAARTKNHKLFFFKRKYYPDSTPPCLFHDIFLLFLEKQKKPK